VPQQMARHQAPSPPPAPGPVLRAVPSAPHSPPPEADAPDPIKPEPATAFSPGDIGITDAETWLYFADNSGLKGAARQLLENAGFAGYEAGVLRLSLDSGFDYLRSERSIKELTDAIAQRYGAAPKLVFVAAAAATETLKERGHRQRSEQQSAAEETFMNHPDVQRLIQQHGAKLVPDSIRPFEE
jgi:DNA polymerase III subunit gamma/tau